MDIHVQGAMVRESGGGGDAGDIDTDGGTNGKGGEAAGDSSTSALGASDVVVTSVIGGGRNTSQARSRQMRAQIRLGWPLQGFERCSTAVCRAEQEAKVSDWATSTLAPLLEELRAEEPNGVQLEYDFEPITRRAMAVVLTSDLILAGMPLAVGFLYLWLYTSSLALALSGVLQLAFAWPCALFFYRYIFWLQHVENLTLLAAPLTAAFSLDAMALLVDAWHSSTVQPVRHENQFASPVRGARSQPHPFRLLQVHVLSSLRARLDWVIRDAGTAAFHSVAVGVAAFAGSGLSPLLNVAHLGLFCAIQLTVQLLLALCLLPACLVLYHNWLEPKPNLVCMCLLKTRLLNGTPGTRVAKAGDVAGKATLFASVSQIWQPLEQTSTEHHHATRMIEATLPGLQQLQSVPKGSLHLAAAAAPRPVVSAARRESESARPPSALLCASPGPRRIRRWRRVRRPSPPATPAAAPPAAAYSYHDRAQFSPIVAGADCCRDPSWGVAGVAAAVQTTAATGGRWTSSATRPSMERSSGAMRRPLSLTRPRRSMCTRRAPCFADRLGCGATPRGTLPRAAAT